MRFDADSMMREGVSSTIATPGTINSPVILVSDNRSCRGHLSIRTKTTDILNSNQSKKMVLSDAVQAMMTDRFLERLLRPWII